MCSMQDFKSQNESNSTAGDGQQFDNYNLLAKEIPLFNEFHPDYIDHGTKHHLRVYDKIQQLLSDVNNPTPLVQIHKIIKDRYKFTKFFVKLEWYNPFGSVKDRISAHMIYEAKKVAKIKQQTNLVEASSGNTAVGLAFLGQIEKIPLSVALSTKVPQEKKDMVEFFGAKLIEVEEVAKPYEKESVLQEADKIANQENWHQLNQYVNPSNPDAHYQTTGPEIWKQTQHKISHLVCAMGTCGTLTGTGRFLKEQNPDIKVYGVLPKVGHDVPGTRNLVRVNQTIHYKPETYDGVIEMQEKETYEIMQQLNQEESIIAGPSGSMALAGAFSVVPDQEGLVCVVLLPDNIFKNTSSAIKHCPGAFITKIQKQQVEQQKLNLQQQQTQLQQQQQQNVTIDPQEILSFFQQNQSEQQSISFEKANELIEKQNVFVIDIREQQQQQNQSQTFKTSSSVVNIPLSELKKNQVLKSLPEDKNQNILISGNATEYKVAQVFLQLRGYSSIKFISF